MASSGSRADHGCSPGRHVVHANRVNQGEPMQHDAIPSSSRRVSLAAVLALAAVGAGAHAAGACDSVAGKRFAYEVQGVANTGTLTDMPFAAVGRWAFDATGAG